MTRELPPDPSKFRNLNEWARQLYEFQLSQIRFTQETDPAAVLLAHRTNNVLERATPDGILLFDPTYETPVVAIDGNWEPLRSKPLVELDYDTAFNVNGATIVAGGDTIPFNTQAVNGVPWFTFNPSTNDFTLVRGTYYIEGFVSLAKISGGSTKTFTGYLAETSDLTTPVGTVTMGTLSIPSSAAADETHVVPFRGQVQVNTPTTYAMVVHTLNTNTRFGTAHNISGYNNVYARLAVSLIGLNE